MRTIAGSVKRSRWGRSRWGLCGALVCLVGAAPAGGQCVPEWHPRVGDPGMDGRVFSMAADSAGGRVYAGGAFEVAGGVLATNIAEWDAAASAWRPMGSGTGGAHFPDVRALAVLAGGDVIAGGTFWAAGGVQTGPVARWDGSAWHALGQGVSGAVMALLALPGGDVVAGGHFIAAGGVPAGRIARWDGSAWSVLGGGVSGGQNPAVFALAALPNGDVVAGGAFTSAGGVGAANIARWDGSGWSPLGSGVNGRVSALAVLGDGSVVAGGDFTTAGGVPAGFVARWDGSSWGPLGSGVNLPVRALAAMEGGVVAGGEFAVAGGVPALHAARWDGRGWGAVGGGTDEVVLAFAQMPGAAGSTDLYMGGGFSRAGGVVGERVAMWGCPVRPCYPDCDGNGVLDFFDFLCFQNAFLAQDPYADCDGDGVLDFFDFLCFQNEFLAGCP